MQADSKHQFVVEEQHHREHYKSEHCKSNVERLLCEEIVHSAMVVYSLHQVSHEFRVKERHWQLQEFDEKVAYQRDIDAQGDMQQQPSADKVNSRSTDCEH